MAIANFNPFGKSLEKVNMAIGGRFGSSVTVFLVQPNDSVTAPGKRIDQDFTLTTLLLRHPELKEAKVAECENFFGETILRVVLPKKQ